MNKNSATAGKFFAFKEMGQKAEAMFYFCLQVFVEIKILRQSMYKLPRLSFSRAGSRFFSEGGSRRLSVMMMMIRIVGFLLA